MNIRKIDSLEYCVQCDDLCKNTCLSYNITKNRYFSPKNKAINILKHIKQNQEIDNELLYSCLHCSKCFLACPHGNNISEVTLFAKEELIVYEQTDKYVENFEEIFYSNEDSIYPDLNFKKISKKYNFQKYTNNSNTIFIPGSDTLFYNPTKINDIYNIFYKLNLEPSLYLLKSDSWLELYYLGYKDEVVTDVKEWLRSIKDITTIITSSLRLIEILKIIKPLINIKTPKVIDLFSYLFENNYTKKIDSFIFINNPITKSFNSKILNELSNNIIFMDQIKYSISDSIFKIFYNLDKTFIKEYFKKNLKKNLDFLVVPDEETKILFLKNKPKKIETRIITLVDLITVT